LEPGQGYVKKITASYNQNKLREFLESAVENDGKKGIRLRKENCMCAPVAVRLLTIRCQDTISED
jgi:hypothetical protein